MSVSDTKSGLQEVPIVTRGESIEKDAVFSPFQEKAKSWLSKAKSTNMDSVNFTAERFELLVDARGFPPESMKCTVTPNAVEIQATRVEEISGAQGKRNMQMARNYQLPQAIAPQQTICCLSSEGILLVTAPWQK